MKTIKNANLFAIAIPLLILVTYPIYKEGSLLFALLSTMITGFIQVIIGLKLLFDEPTNRHNQIYIGTTIAFFTLWFINTKIGYNDVITYILLPIPVILAIYLSILIYKKS